MARTCRYYHFMLGMSFSMSVNFVNMAEPAGEWLMDREYIVISEVCFAIAKHLRRSGMADEELTGMIEELCHSKAEEFRMLGYEHVDGKEIWDCVSAKYAKTGMPELHQLVNDILSLKVTQFMNHMTLSAFKGNPF